MNAGTNGVAINSNGPVYLNADNIGNFYINGLNPVTSTTIAGTSAPTDPCSATQNTYVIEINATPTAYQCSNATGSYAWNTLGGGGGGSVNVNGSPVSSPNFNGTTPAAPGGNTNCHLAGQRFKRELLCAYLAVAGEAAEASSLPAAWQEQAHRLTLSCPQQRRTRCTTCAVGGRILTDFQDGYRRGNGFELDIGAEGKQIYPRRFPFRWATSFSALQPTCAICIRRNWNCNYFES